MARAIAEKQEQKISSAIEQVLAEFAVPLQKIIVSGQGEFLAREAIEKLALSVEIISLAEELGTGISQCAAAHALAVLAGEASDEQQT